MAGFASRADVIAAMNAGRIDRYDVQKTGTSTTVSGYWYSQNTDTGRPVAGTANGTTTPGTAFDSDQTAQVAGAVWFPDRSPYRRYLLSFAGLITAASAADNTQDARSGSAMLYDRLVVVGGISTATGTVTVNSTALTRYTGTAASLNEVWIENQSTSLTQPGSVNLSSYTAADGSTGNVGGTTSYVITCSARCMFQLPFAAGKQGVRSVESVAFTSTVTGTVNLVILRPIARIGMVWARQNEVSFLDDFLAMPRIYDDASLFLANTGQTVVMTNGYSIVCVYG